MNFQRDLSLLFKRREGMYKRLPLKTREEKRARKGKRAVISSFLCVCVCVCLFYCAKRNFVFLCVECVFLSMSVFLKQKGAKRRKKTRDFSCLCVFEFFSFCSPLLLLLQKIRDTNIFASSLGAAFLKKQPKKTTKKKKKRGQRSFN